MIAQITVIAVPVSIVTVIRTATPRMVIVVVASITVVEVESCVTAPEEAETGSFVSALITTIVAAASIVVHRIAPLMVTLMESASPQVQILVSVSTMMTAPATATPTGVTTPSTAFNLAMVLIATVASVPLPSNPRKCSRSEDLSDGHAPQHE